MPAETKFTIIKGSTTALITRLVGALFMLETAYAVLLVFFIVLNSRGADFGTPLIVFLWVVHTVKFFAATYLIIKIVTETMTKRSYITRDHLVVDKGLFTIDEDVYELDQLKRLKVHQNTLGKRLGYGNIELRFGARGFEKTVFLAYVSAPRKYADLFGTHLTE